MTKPRRCTCCRCRLRRRVDRLHDAAQLALESTHAERQRMESHRDWAALTDALDEHPLALEIYGSVSGKIDRAVPRHLMGGGRRERGGVIS